MKSDIPIKKVENLAVAVAPRQKFESDYDLFWDVFLINFKNQPIRNVIINSRGYGEREGEEIRTSQFRFYFDEIAPKKAVPVEQITIEMLDLASEFWVSFWYENYMYDKKYVFVKGSLDKMNFTHIPIVGKKGVMIK